MEAVKTYEHADAMDNCQLIGTYADIGVGPAVVHDGAAWTDPARMRAWIADLTEACDWLAETTGVERTSGDDVDVTVRVRRANLPALEAGVHLGVDDLTHEAIVLRLERLAGGVHGLEVVTNPLAKAATPEPVDVIEHVPGPPRELPTMDQSLNAAFAALFWISEAPNRRSDLDDEAIEMAEHARKACIEIERQDKARKAAA